MFTVVTVSVFIICLTSFVSFTGWGSSVFLYSILGFAGSAFGVKYDFHLAITGGVFMDSITSRILLM